MPLGVPNLLYSRHPPSPQHPPAVSSFPLLVFAGVFTVLAGKAQQLFASNSFLFKSYNQLNKPFGRELKTEAQLEKTHPGDMWKVLHKNSNNGLMKTTAIDFIKVHMCNNERKQQPDVLNWGVRGNSEWLIKNCNECRGPNTPGNVVLL